MVRVRYRDAAHGVDEIARGTLNATGSWDYSRAVLEGAPRELEYSALIQYSDGNTEETPWRTLGPDEQPPAIQARRYKFSVIVDGSRLDWTRWTTAYVHMEYADRAHSYTIATEAPLRVTSEASLHRFDVLAFSPQARTYRYRVTLVPRAGDPVEVPAAGDLASSDKGLLLLDTLVR
jgi:hypothetical protein